jgi:hypothetical protein
LEEYLLAALQLLQEHWINRYSFDWPGLTERCKAFLLQCGDAHEAVRYALAQLGDSHSHLVVSADGAGNPPASIGPTGYLLESKGRKIGVLNIPGFLGSDKQAFAFAIREALVELRMADPYAWVVNLWDDWGGDMWPMIAGLGPLLGSRYIGATDFGQERHTWFYDNGAVGICLDSGVEHEFLRIPNLIVTDEQLSDCRSAPVAVLIGNDTASSGEAVAIAFRGRERTRFFGKRTYGLSTSNREFILSDGARLYVAVAVMADRNGILYESGLNPDEEVEDCQQALGAAIRWFDT